MSDPLADEATAETLALRDAVEDAVGERFRGHQLEAFAVCTVGNAVIVSFLCEVRVSDHEQIDHALDILCENARHDLGLGERSQ